MNGVLDIDEIVAFVDDIVVDVGALELIHEIVKSGVCGEVCGCIFEICVGETLGFLFFKDRVNAIFGVLCGLVGSLVGSSVSLFNGIDEVIQ